MPESDPDKLAEVRRQIRALKLAEHPVVRLVSPDWGSTHEVSWRPWAEIPEAGKLNMLQDLVDWQGISNRDMAHILLGELDVGKLSSGQRDLLIRLAQPVPDRHLELSLEKLKQRKHGQQACAGKRPRA